FRLPKSNRDRRGRLAVDMVNDDKGGLCHRAESSLATSTLTSIAPDDRSHQRDHTEQNAVDTPGMWREDAQIAPVLTATVRSSIPDCETALTRQPTIRLDEACRQPL